MEQVHTPWSRRTERNAVKYSTDVGNINRVIYGIVGGGLISRIGRCERNWIVARGRVSRVVYSGRGGDKMHLKTDSQYLIAVDSNLVDRFSSGNVSREAN